MKRIDVAMVTWWVVKVLSLLVGILATWWASVGLDVPVRVVYVLLIDGAWWAFWWLTDQTPRKELLTRVVYAAGLVLMTGVVLVVALRAGMSDGVVDLAARVAVVFLVGRSVYMVAADYSGYRQENAQALLDQYRKREERRRERLEIRDEVAYWSESRRLVVRSKRVALRRLEPDVVRYYASVARGDVGLPEQVDMREADLVALPPLAVLRSVRGNGGGAR